MKNFWSTFLACLLALVVANVVIGVFLVMVLAGIGTLFSERRLFGIGGIVDYLTEP